MTKFIIFFLVVMFVVFLWFLWKLHQEFKAIEELIREYTKSYLKDEDYD
jgi:regulatory protein YycH of two-component signal transduction system YycFG